jgi:hypothetical protein
MAFVNTTHVKIHVPAFRLYGVYYVWHVRGYSDHQPGVTNAFYVIVNLIELACFEERDGP